MSVLETIGGTSPVAPGRLLPEGCARILLKMEGENPTGSMKDTGAGFVVPPWRESLANEIQTVSSAEAMAMARRLAREEGIFAAMRMTSAAIRRKSCSCS